MQRDGREIGFSEVFFLIETIGVMDAERGMFEMQYASRSKEKRIGLSVYR
jgi:hypothetical protein